MLRIARLMVVLLVMAGCGSSGPSSPPPSSDGPSATPSPVPSMPATAPPSDPASEPPGATPDPTEPTGGGLRPGTVAEVVTDDLRVRTIPEVSDASVRLRPLLQPGDTLYVVDGPVSGSGFAWVQVLLFGRSLTPVGSDVDAEQVEIGWVAVADKDTGEQWVAPAEPACPDRPSTVRELLAIEGDTALACFAGTPITIEAHVLSCEDSDELMARGWCEMDTGSPTFSPAWFDRTFTFLVDPDTELSEETTLELHADPNGTYPDRRAGETVEVTGEFDHPDASACTVYHYFQTNQPSVYCRTVFAVTSMRDAGS